MDDEIDDFDIYWVKELISIQISVQGGKKVQNS